jgi:hypothetical protein
MLLYKYFSQKRSSFLKELMIRFTPPGSFNDPFDSLPAMDGFDANFIQEKVDKNLLDVVFDCASSDVDGIKNKRKMLVLPEARKILMKQYTTMPGGVGSLFQKLYSGKINREIGILCLSENSRSILMWSHYADEHKGFAIGFESSDAFFSHQVDEPDDIGLLRRVSYSKKRIHIDVRKIKNECAPDMFFSKNEDWSYEQEWRIIRFLHGAEHVTPQNIHLFKVPSSAIREVILGCKVEPKTTEALLALVKENPELKQVSFFEAMLSRTEYEMDIFPFTP